MFSYHEVFLIGEISAFVHVYMTVSEKSLTPVFPSRNVLKGDPGADAYDYIALESYWYDEKDFRSEFVRDDKAHREVRIQHHMNR